MKCLYGMLKNILLEFESDHVVFFIHFFFFAKLFFPFYLSMHSTHQSYSTAYISTEQGISMKNQFVDFLTPEICRILKRFNL